MGETGASEMQKGAEAEQDAKLPRKRGITWDEENIDECEKGKDSTMIIDEPPTPFNYYDPAQDECEEDPDDPALSPRSVGSEEAETNQQDLSVLEEAVAARFEEPDEDKEERQKEASKSNFAAQREVVSSCPPSAGSMVGACGR